MGIQPACEGAALKSSNFSPGRALNSSERRFRLSEINYESAVSVHWFY